MKLVNLQHLGVKNLSEYQAATWIKEHAKELIPTQDSTILARTKTDLLYKMNKTVASKRQIYVQRLATLLARQTRTPALIVNTTIIKCGDQTFKIADRIHSKEELEWHKTQAQNVISITQTTLCPYFKLDTETIKKHYTTFNLPKWFEPFTKFRHFRYRLLNSNWEFQRRLYNPTNTTSTKKLKHDIHRYSQQIVKAYFSLGAFLNPKKEKHGTAKPLKIYYIVFDIDGKNHSNCLIESTGICNTCIVEATRKLHEFRKAIKPIKGLRIENVLYSGTKGFHVHCSINGKRETDLKTFTLINRYIVQNHPGIIDDFTYQDDYGDWQYDTHRIFKTPNTCDATTGVLISENFKRLDLQDTITTPEAKK